MSETLEEAMQWIKERRDGRNLSAYYYSFAPTGNPDIDLILAAVAAAGKGYHNTEDWEDERYCGGPSYIDLIQEAARLAAEKMSDLGTPDLDGTTLGEVYDALDYISSRAGMARRLCDSLIPRKVV